MKVAIAGSRRLQPGLAPRVLLRFLLNLPPTVTILLRARADGDMHNTFESDVLRLLSILGIECVARRPLPAETPGRASVFRRDIEMVDEADLTVLFFVPEDAEEGYSGTYHLYEKCLDQDRPVYAWLVESDDKVTRWGEHDPGDQYAGLFA